MTRSRANSSSTPAPQPTAAKSPWSFTVAVSDVPPTGRQVDFAADEHTREAVAKLAGVVALPRLEASFDLSRQGTDGLHAVGRVTATVVQACVVTLDPVQSEIDEPIDLAFTPPIAEAAVNHGGAIHQALDAEDPPEALHNGVADLGAVATEFLILAIDPYPRKEGVAFDAPARGEDATGHPFAALAALKQDRGPKNR